MAKYQTTFISCFISALVVTVFSLDIITDIQERLNVLEIENISLLSKIEELENRESRLEFIVTATMYNPLRYQTDRTPTELADGTKINPKKASQYRYVALSRDLLERWGGPFGYGDYVVVTGTKNGKYDGMWQVRDTMSAKWVKRIDFLVSSGTKLFKQNEIKITKMMG